MKSQPVVTTTRISVPCRYFGWSWRDARRPSRRAGERDCVNAPKGSDDVDWGCATARNPPRASRLCTRARGNMRDSARADRRFRSSHLWDTKYVCVSLRISCRALVAHNIQWSCNRHDGKVELHHATIPAWVIQNIAEKNNGGKHERNPET